jgi:2-polyprenyl-3-methyl-5-hydroxy-6-metoxy-1,4-benzoquinol methylase
MEADVKEVIRAHWNGRATIFDSSPNHAIATLEERHEWERTFATYIGRERRKILDIGTGTGEIALLLARAGHDVTGIDLAEKMLAEAQLKAAARGLEAKFLCDDAEHLIQERRSFGQHSATVTNVNTALRKTHFDQE